MFDQNKPFNYKWSVLLLFLTIIAELFISQSSAMNSKEILEDIFDRQGIISKGSFVMEIKVLSYNGTESNPAVVRVYFYDNSKQLVTFVEPARLKDSYYLVNGFNTWMYQQGLRRPIRISAQQKLFGDAGIAETAGINYIDDYNILKTDESDVQYIIDLKAKDTRTAYQMVTIWVEKKNLLIRQIDLKALNGQILKTLNYQKYNLVDGHEVATIEIINVFQEKDKKTVMEFTSIISRKLPVEAFDPLMMGKFRF